MTTSTVNRQEIEDLDARTAVDALDFTPSVLVRRKGRKNGFSLSIRGEGNTTVLLDGMNLQDNEDYRYIHFLPAALLQEVRVIRDSTSLMYGPPKLNSPNGTTGYGGVIDFRLREPPAEKTTGGVRAELARFEENLEHFDLAGPLGARAGYILSLDNQYYSGPGGENMSHDFRNLFGRLRFRYDAESAITFTTIVERGWRELQQAEDYSFFHNYIQEFNPWKTNIYMVQINHVWTENISTRIEAFYRYHEATLYDHQYGGLQFDSRESKRGINVRQTIRTAERNTLRFGGQVGYWNCPTGKMYYGAWRYNKKTKKYVLKTFPRREINYSLYLQDEFMLIPDKLFLDGGTRWDRKYVYSGYTANGPGLGNPANAGVPYYDRWQDPAVSWSAGVRYQLNPDQVLTARYALSTEAASSEYVDAAGRQMPNTQEKRLELGYQVRFSPKLTLGLNAFWKRIDNALSYAGITAGGDPYWNAREFDRTGIEFLAKGKLNQTLDWFLNTTLINSVDKTAERHDKKIPRLNLSTGLRWHDGPWRAAVSVKEVSGYKDDFAVLPAGHYVHVGDYTLVDLRLGYRIARGRFTHEIYCGVRNLTNQHYRTFPGWKDPGRSAYIGYELRF